MKTRVDLEQSKTEPSPPRDDCSTFAPRVVVWRDLRWTLVWGGPDAHGFDSSLAWTNFRLFEIVAFDLGEHPLYEKRGTRHPLHAKPTTTPDEADAEPAFVGFVACTTDAACMQWRASPEYLFHADSCEDLRRMHEALSRTLELRAAKADQADPEDGYTFTLKRTVLRKRSDHAAFLRAKDRNGDPLWGPVEAAHDYAGADVDVLVRDMHRFECEPVDVPLSPLPLEP